MSKRMIWIVFAVIAVAILVPAWLIEDWRRDLTTNNAKLKEHHADESLRPLNLSLTPVDVAQRLETWASEQSAWALVAKTDRPDGVDMHLTHRTRLLRFTDDVHIEVRAVDGGVTVNAESKSRIGKGDLGQNPRNLRELVGVLRGFER